jgi:hypothetical protein
MQDLFDKLKSHTKESDSGCWEWQRGKHASGYGGVGPSWGGGSYAHRAMWEAANGAIPQGKYVLHRCDNRCCINPDHLFLGTHLDNIRDMQAKNRHRGGSLPGESNPNSKHSDATVFATKWARLIGYTSKEVQDAFGVSESFVTRICHHGWRKEACYGL